MQASDPMSSAAKILGDSAGNFMKGGRRKSKVYRGGNIGNALSTAVGGVSDTVKGTVSALFNSKAPTTAPAEVKTGGGRKSRSLQRGKSLAKSLGKSRGKSRGRSRERSMRRARAMQASRAGGRKTRRKHRSRKHSGGVILQ
jgi:hypothetical protein